MPPNTEININVRTQRQYLNTDSKLVNPNSESVDVSVSIENGDQQLFILGESKVNGTADLKEAKKRLFKQFVKHIELEVYDPLVDTVGNTNTLVAELRYNLQGKAFDNVDKDELAREAMEYLAETKSEIFDLVTSKGFVFSGSNISVLTEKLHPIVN